MKKPISATIEAELIDWIDKEVLKNKDKYRNKSHLIEVAIDKLRKEK
jgi:Arc/MetJ-type ribon-helix-helix transcriptional regulator